MITQINPPLPLKHVDKGSCLAHFLIDYGMEHDLYWVVFVEDSGEIWTVNNKMLRADKNITIGRIYDRKGIPMSEMPVENTG